MSSFNLSDFKKSEKAPIDVGRAALDEIKANLDVDLMAAWWGGLRSLDRARFCRLSGFPESSHVLPWSGFCARDRALMSKAIRIVGTVARTMPGGA